jgi:hypothetical protein
MPNGEVLEEHSTGTSSLFAVESQAMPGIDFQRVRSNVSLVQVLDLFGFKPTGRCGNELPGECPIHPAQQRRSRAFTAKIAKNVYHGYVCGAAGDPINLWARVHRTDVFAATLDLCEKLHCEVPWIGRPEA